MEVNSMCSSMCSSSACALVRMSDDMNKRYWWWWWCWWWYTSGCRGLFSGKTLTGFDSDLFPPTLKACIHTRDYILLTCVPQDARTFAAVPVLRWMTHVMQATRRLFPFLTGRRALWRASMLLRQLLQLSLQMLINMLFGASKLHHKVLAECVFVQNGIIIITERDCSK